VNKSGRETRQTYTWMVDHLTMLANPLPDCLVTMLVAWTCLTRASMEIGLQKTSQSLEKEGGASEGRPTMGRAASPPRWPVSFLDGRSANRLSNFADLLPPINR
jgi:hypothetical protein